MKEKDLYIDFEPHKLIYYVEKEDNTYGPIISGSQLSANYLDDFWEKKKKLEASLRQQIINNEISPVYYYMILQEIGEKDLASRAGISMSKLKRLFKPEGFSNIKLNKLKIFAEIFNIPISNLLQMVLIKEDDKKNIQIEYNTTKNDLFNIVKIKRG